MDNKIVLIIRRNADYWYYNKISKYKLNVNMIRLRELWDSFFNYKIIDFCNSFERSSFFGEIIFR